MPRERKRGPASANATKGESSGVQTQLKGKGGAAGALAETKGGNKVSVTGALAKIGSTKGGPAKSTSAKQIPSKQTPAKQTSAKQAPAKQTPSIRMKQQQTTTKPMKSKQTSPRQTSAKQTSKKKSLGKQPSTTKPLVKQSLVKQSPPEQTQPEQSSVKQSLVEQSQMNPITKAAKPRQIPVTQGQVDKELLKQGFSDSFTETPPNKLQTIPLTSCQVDKTSRIWTVATSERFYTNVRELSRKIHDAQSVQVAENYRFEGAQENRNSGDYVLAYDEELHLADHFAFLAHVSDRPEFVSAVTFEQSEDPPAFIVRLASNSTPNTDVQQRLGSILQIIKEHASEGRHGDQYKARLFDEVVRLSQKRIYARLRCSQWEMPPSPKRPRPASLSLQLEKALVKLRAGSAESLIVELINSIEQVDKGNPGDQLEILKDVIRKSYAVTHQGTSRSLGNALRTKGLDKTICESREVLEIDKLSKYLEICDDLIRLSRQPSTRMLCTGLRLEILQTSSSRPVGSGLNCHVHGEVQLVLFHERYPRLLRPRAIGSSKSACFLCDIFIKMHGAFGISHSHMKLYPLWTIPEAPWMSARQSEMYQGIIRQMTEELEALAKNQFYHPDAVIESRAHLRQIVPVSDTASSLPSSVLFEPKFGQSTDIPMDTTVFVTTSESSMLTQLVPSFHYLQDLPIALDILPTTISCTLFVGQVHYIFDVKDVKQGSLLVSECSEEEEIPKDRRVDVRNLSSSEEQVLDTGTSTRIMFQVHDAGEHMLRVDMSWELSST